MFITSVIDEMGARHPDKLAVTCGGARLTFRELSARTARLAGNLRERGIAAGDTVGLLMPSSVDYAACLVAPLRIGAVSVPLGPRLGPGALARVFSDCRLSALITTGRLLRDLRGTPLGERLGRLKALIVDGRGDDGPRGSDALPLAPMLEGGAPAASVPVEPDAHAIYIYTSGSTGSPKGVILTHGIIARRGANRRNLSVTADDRCYTIGGLDHNGKLFIGLVWSLYLGMTFHTDAGFHPLVALQRLAAERVTLLHASPFHFAVLAGYERYPVPVELPALRLCISSGNRLEPAVARRFERRFGVGIVENYGITEAGGLCSDGVALEGVEIRILDEDGEELGPGRLGRIVVAGPGRALGYLRRPDLTAARFRGRWFHTGDLGRVDASGRLEVVCRAKNALSIAGRTVYPEEIQAVLRDHPLVEDALVAADGPERLRALVVPRGGVELSAEVLREHCRGRLPPHEVPGAVELRADLPRPWKRALERDRFDELG